MHKRILIPLLTLFLAATAFAQDKSKQLADMIAPFVDDQTVAVGVADLSAVEFDAIKTWLIDTAKRIGVPEPRADDPELAAAAKWVADFRKAGGKHIFTVINPADVPFVPVIVPLEEGADAKAIGALLAAGAGPLTQARIGNAIVMSSPNVLERLRQQKPAPRPDLAIALAAAGDVPVRAVIIPSSDIRRIIAELMPNLPKQAGGGSTESISKGLSWAAGGATLPAKPSVHIVIQCQDATSAKAMSNLIAGVYGALKSNPELKELRNADQIFAAITPAVNNDRLVLNVSSDDISNKIIPLLAPPLEQARERANRVKSMSNIRQMLQCFLLYAGSHKGEPPENFDVLVKEADLHREVFINPRDPSRKPAYIYLKPGNLKDVTAEQVVIYEAFDQWGDGINVGFGDGHVDWMGDRQEFEKMLQASKDRIAGKK